jgi:ankyrin repeat protein
MEERRPTPLPPGVIPSGSREDLYAQLQEESEAQKPEEKLLVEDLSSEEEEQQFVRRPRKKAPKERVVVVEVHPNVPGEDPSSAWRTGQNGTEHEGASPQRIRSYRLPTEDLEGESSGSEVDSVVSPVFKDPPTPSEKERTLVESPSTPSKKKTNILKGLFGSIQRPSTPPRPMSPFRKTNRVAPMPSSSSQSEPSPSEERRTLSSPVVPLSSKKKAGHSSTPQREGPPPTTSSPTVISNTAVRHLEEKDIENEPQYSEIVDPGDDGRESNQGQTCVHDVVSSSSPTDHSVVVVNTLQNVQEEPLYSPVLKHKKNKQKPSPENVQDEPLYSPVLKHKKKNKQKPSPDAQSTGEFVYPNPSTSAEDLSSANRMDPSDVPPLAKITPVSTPVDGRSRQMGTQTLHDYYATIDQEVTIDSESSESDAATEQEAKLRKLKKSLHKEQKRSVVETGASGPSTHLQQDVVDYLPIHYAAMNGNKKELSSVIEAMKTSGGSLDAKDSDGRTALMHAVHGEHFSCVRLLVNQGADINAKSFDGSTALHQAAYMNSRAAVGLVLGLGGDGLIKDNDGRLPLHWATNNSSSQCMEIMLDKVVDLDVNINDYVGMTPLMWAAFNNQPQNILFLKTLGASLSARDLDGMSALHWAVHRNSTDALQVLIDAQSSRYKDKKGKTVMHVIAEQGCAKGVSMLRAIRPASVNDIDNQGRTPIHWAAACEKPDAIRALLDAGADPTILDSNGYSPVDYAASKGYHYCVLLLEQYKTVGPGTSSDSQIPSLVGTPEPSPQLHTLEQVDSGCAAVREDEETRQRAKLLKLLCHGGWLQKFTGKGRGPLHKRYFWLNIGNGKICWANINKPSDSDIRADDFVDVKSSASSFISSRRDYDPLVKHKYAFTIVTTSRILDVVANSSVEYKIWINGLGLLCQLGIQQASQVLAHEN